MSQGAIFATDLRACAVSQDPNDELTARIFVAPERPSRTPFQRDRERIVQARAAAAGFGRLEFGGHSLKRGALTTGMQQKAHAGQLKRLGRHKSFDVLGEYLEFGDLFGGHPLSGVL